MREQVLEILNHPLLELGKHCGDATASPDRTVTQLLGFLAEWKKWSRRIDLTSEADDPSFLRKHVFDSLQYARALRCDGRTLDIGSGAGFPGIPLKIVCPEMQMVLVESRGKRANFLKSVVRALKLENIEVINARAEDLECHGQFDQVVFKAVAPLPQCLEWGFPFLKEDGRIVIKKEPADHAGEAYAEIAGLRLREKIPIQSLSGVSSDLLVFQKCST